MVYNNAANINPTGLVKADGSGGFSGETTTQYNVLVGGTSNGISNVAPSATTGIALVSQGVASNPAFGTVVPAGGGTGTTTVFTQGSVIFAGASGIYSQDNANLFFDDTNNRLGVGTNSPASSLSVNGGVSIGTYAPTDAAPTNGMIVSGKVGIGTATTGVNNSLQVNPATAHGVSVQGTITAVDGNNDQHGYNVSATFAPTAGSDECSSYEGTPIIAAPVGQTIITATTFHSSPRFTGNAGTISTVYGFYSDAGGASVGTITNNYGAFFAKPTAGTNRYALYAEEATIGSSTTTPPTNGLAIAGDVSQVASLSGASLVVLTSNTSNTASAQAYHQCQIAGATAGDAFFQANITSGQSWVWGLDNSDSDAYVLAASATLGTTNVMRVSTAGDINYPLQPAFSASLSADVANATGDGTAYTIAFNTEQYDQGGDFAANTFTAPVAGRYRFNYTISVDDLLVGHTKMEVTVGGRMVERCNPFAIADSDGFCLMSGSVDLSLAASATVTMIVTITGSTKTVTVKGTTSSGTFLSGQLEV